MAAEIEIKKACALLETDVLRHIAALKMIQLYGRDAAFSFKEDNGDWALLTRVPAGRAVWDRAHYGAAEVIIVDGSRPELELELLDSLGAAAAVVKTAEDAVGRALVERGAKHRASLVSFTRGAGTAGAPAPLGVEVCSKLTEDTIELFGRNGYERAELAAYFARGARWFGVKEKTRTVSGCFVYPNYAPVWEIGGVYTDAEYRGRGWAKKTVAAALAYLLQRGFLPRYQTESGNAASIGVARGAGLAEFLRMRHYLWENR